MSDSFRDYPVGHSISGSPHSMCVSLPTMADVIAYEEKDPAIMAAFQAGYPRFFRNPLIRTLASRWAAEGRMGPEDPLLATEAAARDLCQFARIPETAIHAIQSVWSVHLPADESVRQDAAAFLRHTGSGLSSREAEDLLAAYGHPRFPELRAAGGREKHLHTIKEHLHAVYGTRRITDIHLFRSGMNGFYSGFRALQEIQLEAGKDLWIQLGWLYVDTARILERFSAREAAPIQLYQVVDLDELHEVLKLHGRRVAGIVTEIPTNPLVQTVDLEALRATADKYKAALILDPTLVSPHNVNILSFSDLHINSLTKYAAAEADVMMGAVALNHRSAFYKKLRDTIAERGTAPADGDLARMAAQIGNYEWTVLQVNANTEKVAAFLQSHPMVKQLFWARTYPSAYNYQWLQHQSCGPGSILTFTLNKPLADFYDASRLVKSPSFGARFTMMCPFMYLAHYDQVKSEAGRAELLRHGVDPELIRLSVGTEPAEAIIAELERTLRP